MRENFEMVPYEDMATSTTETKLHKMMNAGNNIELIGFSVHQIKLW